MNPQGSASPTPPEVAAPPREAAAPPSKASRRALALAAPWIVTTYFAEGLPYSIVHQVSTELFVYLKTSLAAVGLTALFGLAWNAKALWSPLVDMYGTTRRWLIATELVLAVAVAAIAWPAERADIKAVAVAFAAVALLSATHDIAIDGFYIRALPKDQQASLSGFRIPAYRAALLAGKGGLVWVAGHYSWRTCFLAAGGILLALSALHAAILPREERRQEATKLRYGDAFRTFFLQPGALVSVAFILTYRAGDALMFAMSSPLLNTLGLDLKARGWVSGTLGTLAFMAGATLGGMLIGRFDLRRTLVPISVAQSAAIPLYVWMAWAKPSLWWITAVVVTEQFVAGVGSAALLIFLMRRTSGEYKASHFAIGTSMMSVGATLLGAASGFIANEIGFVAFFALAFAASLPGVLLSLRVPTE